MAMVFIFGTSHTLQCGDDSRTEAEVALYDAEIRSICIDHKILRISEEMCADGLAAHNVKSTVGYRVAKKLRLQHQYVDLPSDERKLLSIDENPLLVQINHFSPADGGEVLRYALDDLAQGIRERVWVARMLTAAEWPTLFICGSAHAEPVQRLFTMLSFHAVIVQRDYEP